MKKAELIITQAWQNNAPWLSALAPLSALYKAVSSVRKSLYDTGRLARYRAPVPLIVIGNITVGGSGKTPLIIALVAYLQSKGVSVGVISRGYGRQNNEPMLVTPDATSVQVGDEPCLIVQSTGVPMAVGANRGQAIDLLCRHHPDITLILSDDGLQHHALHRDAEWIVVDGVRGFGNAKLFPQGFLREPLSRLDAATVIYHDPRAERYAPDVLRMQLIAGVPTPLLATTEPVALPKKVYGLSGIGYPIRFFNTLSEMGFEVVARPFGDHHDFSLDDLVGLDDLPIITTSKDAVKLRELAKSGHPIFKRIWVLPVNAVLSDGVYDMLNKFMSDHHIQMNGHG